MGKNGMNIVEKFKHKNFTRWWNNEKISFPLKATQTQIPEKYFSHPKRPFNLSELYFIRMKVFGSYSEGLKNFYFILYRSKSLT